MNDIERTLEFDAAPERVWRALTDAKEIAAWFGDTAEFDARPGGEGSIGWEEHGNFAVRVEECEPPTRLAWRWARDRDVPVDDGPSTLVEWTLTPSPGGGTVLSLRESGFVREEDWQENVGGWEYELAELVQFLGQDSTAPTS